MKYERLCVVSSHNTYDFYNCWNMLWPQECIYRFDLKLETYENIMRLQIKIKGYHQRRQGPYGVTGHCKKVLAGLKFWSAVSTMTCYIAFQDKGWFIAKDVSLEFYYKLLLCKLTEIFSTVYNSSLVENNTSDYAFVGKSASLLCVAAVGIYIIEVNRN